MGVTWSVTRSETPMIVLSPSVSDTGVTLQSTIC